jgi:hypothetical protein
MRISAYGLTGLASVALAVVSASCRVAGPISARQRVMYQWHDDGGPGKVSVRISLADQIAEFERGGREIGWCYVATGKQGHGTSPGSYRISEKIEDKYSTHYGLIEDEFGNVVNGDASPGDRVPPGMVYVPAPMPYWMRLTSGGIGMHGGLIPEPGKPASHGCIRMPKDFAPVLFDAVEVGTPVTITGGRSRRTPMIESPPQQWVGESRVIATRPLAPSEQMSGSNSDPGMPVMDPGVEY